MTKNNFPAVNQQLFNKIEVFNNTYLPNQAISRQKTAVFDNKVLKIVNDFSKTHINSTKVQPLFRNMLGETLREIRRSRGWTLKNLSTLAGVSLSFMSEVERGAKEVSSEVLLSICQAFGISIDRLLDKISARYKLLNQIDTTMSE
ncbi:MAG: helix-turn-helix domain-containing protein [Bifidobacteriaceae bacterium]|jgi:DNA-binding XRE family transcriptional regulator|nr:helix-turn-helix domain-containing protein [Bifidobacteriaceae bacterium]